MLLLKTGNATFYINEESAVAVAYTPEPGGLAVYLEIDGHRIDVASFDDKRASEVFMFNLEQHLHLGRLFGEDKETVRWLWKLEKGAHEKVKSDRENLLAGAVILPGRNCPKECARDKYIALKQAVADWSRLSVGYWEELHALKREEHERVRVCLDAPEKECARERSEEAERIREENNDTT